MRGVLRVLLCSIRSHKARLFTVPALSPAEALAAIWRSEGLRGMYRGYLPGLAGTIHGGIQFMVYEELKQRGNQWQGRGPNDKLVRPQAVQTNST